MARAPAKSKQTPDRWISPRRRQPPVESPSPQNPPGKKGQRNLTDKLENATATTPDKDASEAKAGKGEEEEAKEEEAKEEATKKAKTIKGSTTSSPSSGPTAGPTGRPTVEEDTQDNPTTSTLAEEEEAMTEDTANKGEEEKEDT